MSQIGQFMSLNTPVQTLTGNTGGAVAPTGGNINVIGSGAVTVTGNPGTSTLTISIGGSFAESFVTDSGTATPSGGVLNVLGGTNIATTGSGNTVTVNLDNDIFVNSVSTTTNLPNSGLIMTGISISSTGSNSIIDMLLDTKGGGELIFDGLDGAFDNSYWITRQNNTITNDATATTLFNQTLNSNITAIKGMIVGFKDDLTAGLAADVFVSGYHDGVSSYMLGTPIISINTNSTATVTCLAAGTSLQIRVTGVAAETWNWVGTIQYMSPSTAS